MDKERLRKLFGEAGDVHNGLAEMYGSAYLDHPDDSKLGIPNDFPDKENWYHVNNLVRRAIDNAKEIDCSTNQSLLIKHLLLYMWKGEGMSSQEGWQVSKHLRSDTCTDPDCQNLDNIACMDKYLTPKEMKASYRGEIHRMRAELKKKT